MHFKSKFSMLVLATLSSLAKAIPVLEHSYTKRTSTFQFTGINKSGPEFGGGGLPGLLNKDCTWPDLTTIQTFVSKVLNTFCVNILMERMSPESMTGALDPSHVGNLTRTVDAVTNTGSCAMTNPHNYGRYYIQIITDTDAFIQFWQNVASIFKDNDKVIFDTNNEFHDMSTFQVIQLNQAAMYGIRAAGASSQYITVEGNAWTGA